MAAGDHTVVGTMTADKVAVTDTVVVANLNADQVDGADKDIDGTLAGNSDASVPTEKAVKTYVDTHAALAVAGTHGSTVAATANKAVHRDAAGRAKVAAPAEADDIARKDTPAVGVIETGASAVLKCKVIEIGDWDMATATGSATITKAHGIADYEKIRSIEVLIRADSDASFYALNKLDCLRSISGRVEILQSNTSLLQLFRGADVTSMFDDGDFNATGYNRGWITIWYEV